MMLSVPHVFACIFFVQLFFTSVMFVDCDPAKFSRSKRAFHNSVTGVYTSCTKKELSISVKTTRNFNGFIYARGYPTECTVKGQNRTTTDLKVSPQECGTKIIKEDDGSHTYKMLIYVQFDRWVQQVTDEQVSVTCGIDKSRDLLVTGISKINVEDLGDVEDSILDQDLETKGRAPKYNSLGLSDLFPSNMINFPSKLQQMITNHMKSNQQQRISSSEMQDQESWTKVEIQESTDEVLSPSTVATATKTSSLPTGAPEDTIPVEVKLPIQIMSSFLSITDKNGNGVPYKGIFKAPHKEGGSEVNLQPVNLYGEWRPLIPSPHDLTDKIDKWKTLLGTGGINGDLVSCWLDIIKGNSPFGKSVKEQLFVGETVTLVVRVRRQSGIDTRVTNCKAHDGSGINVQELVDRNGCSIDEEIMSTFKTKILPETSEEISYAPFKAFKFPDHDNLHLKCTVEICMEHCEKKYCGRKRHRRQSGSFYLIKEDGDQDRLFGHLDELKSSQQYFPHKQTTTTTLDTTKKPIWSDFINKDKRKKPSIKGSSSSELTSSGGMKMRTGQVVDNVEVFNSVEVRAPELEEEQQIRNDFQTGGNLKSNQSSESFDKDIFCISSTKIVACFGILLAILVLALLVAMYWCTKDKIQRTRIKSRDEITRTPQRLAFNTSSLPHTRFPGVVEYSKFHPLSSPYRRFQH